LEEGGSILFVKFPTEMPNLEKYQFQCKIVPYLRDKSDNNELLMHAFCLITERNLQKMFLLQSSCNIAFLQRFKTVDIVEIP
jgi:hypothetical protein